MKIDEINISIINHLKDGRISFKKIADDLLVSEGTIRARVKRLQEEGVLEIVGLVDPEAIRRIWTLLPRAKSSVNFVV
jgi:Lrp/AsnC family transcriptional regulator for asnA, asnC and gidA